MLLYIEACDKNRFLFFSAEFVVLSYFRTFLSSSFFLGHEKPLIVRRPHSRAKRLDHNTCSSQLPHQGKRYKNPASCLTPFPPLWLQGEIDGPPRFHRPSLTDVSEERLEDTPDDRMSDFRGYMPEDQI